MQNYIINLQCESSQSFRAIKAANSVDLDITKKLNHKLEISADIPKDFNIGLIYGNSGSGKTTLCKKIYPNFELFEYDQTKAIIDLMPSELNYEECSDYLTKIGLSSVPCWLKSINTLSNGQKYRADALLQILHQKNEIILDEWTSVVDRTIAEIMSLSINKLAKKLNKKIILLSCHEDIIPWAKPDWLIDCNNQIFENTSQIDWDSKKKSKQFIIRKVERSTWRNFSKYHYLNENLAGGLNYFYGLFLNNKQIGFIAYSNYVPKVKNKKMILHANRIVIHPDYCGIGLGIKMLNKTAFLLNKKYKIMIKFSSKPILKALMKDDNWVMTTSENMTTSGNMNRKSGFRNMVKFYSFTLKDVKGI